MKGFGSVAQLRRKLKLGDDMKLTAKQKKMVNNDKVCYEVCGDDVNIKGKEKYRSLNVFTASLENAIEVAKEFGIVKPQYISVNDDLVILVD